MTAYAGSRTVYRPYLPPLGESALETVRGSLRQWRSAFSVAAPSRGTDVGDAALLSLARD